MPESSSLLRSVHLGNERPIWVVEPRDPRTARHLTIFLDGEFYRDRVGAPSVVEGLGDRIADTWIVYVSMHSVEARWIECPCHPPFARFVVGELLPWLTARHPAMRVVRHRVIAGLSYTGLAAAYVAQENPGVFQCIIAQSGSFWWNDGWLIKHASPSPGPAPAAFYLDVGLKEVAENVQHKEDVFQKMSQIEGVQRFRDILIRRGHEVKYVEFDGGHDMAAWRQTLPGALTWALSKS